MISVTTVHPSSPSGQPPVLLVHGAAKSGSVWKYWQESLACLGWSSHALDLRGHGRSSGSVDGASMMAYADDVAEAAKGLPEAPVVLGWSMGGLVALMFAAKGLARACVALAPSTPAAEHDSGVEIRAGTFGPEEYGITGDDPADQPAMPDKESHSWMPAIPARCARSMKRARSKTNGAARVESEHRKLTLSCIRRPSQPNRSMLSHPSFVVLDLRPSSSGTVRQVCV